MTDRSVALRVLLVALVILSGVAGAMVAPAAASVTATAPMWQVDAGAENDTNATATPTPTPSTDSTSDETDSTSNENESENANTTSKGLGEGEKATTLTVIQPSYAKGPVTMATHDGLKTYTASGDVLYVRTPFNASAVVKAGVREDSASLEWNEEQRRFVFNPNGKTGTYQLWFVVEANDGTRTTYRANLLVEVAKYVHLSEADHTDLKEGASAWDDVLDMAEDAGLCDPSSDASPEGEFDACEGALKDAFEWYQFYLHPFSAFAGQTLGIVMMFVQWPAGWFLLSIVAVLYYVGKRRDRKQNRRYRAQFESIEDIDSAEKAAERRELNRNLNLKPFEELGLTVSGGAALREAFKVDTPRQALEKVREAFNIERMIRLLLSAYSQQGYRARVSVSDGGPNAMPAVDLVAPDEFETTVDDTGREVPVDPALVDLHDLDGSEVLALDWSVLDPEVLWAEDVDPSKLRLPIANDATEEDLVDALGIAISEDGANYAMLDRREEFADLLIDFIEHVAADDDVTDETGRLRKEVDFIDFMYTFTAMGSEQYRYPLWDLRDILLRARQRLDPSERMESAADQATQGEL